jgi:small redox-active disulfide protein 2
MNNNTDIKKSPLGDLGVLKPINMDIKVLGTGCPKCKSLEKATREAVAEAGIDATVTKVEDIVEIMNYGVMTTPALVIDGKVVVKGKVPSVAEIKSLITK